MASVKSVRVPDAFLGPFAQAEPYVQKLFAGLEMDPTQGYIRAGGDRYVLMRCESLYVAWFDALADTFGPEAANMFIYNTAREIGRSDSGTFSERLGVEDGLQRLASGPIHFSHAGWALVEILADSRPAPDEHYYLHYYHPNTFESEVLKRRERHVEGCACLFSAGYSAGWCSDAFKIDVHAREIRCTARGDERCEFIMAPIDKLDGYEQQLLEG